jgi:hypothetical protein
MLHRPRLVVPDYDIGRGLVAGGEREVRLRQRARGVGELVGDHEAGGRRVARRLVAPDAGLAIAAGLAYPRAAGSFSRPCIFHYWVSI